MPIILSEFKYKVISGKGKQFQIAAKLINSVGESDQDKTELWTLSQDEKFLVPVDLAIYIYEASREEVDAVASLVESVENRYEQHPEIQNIINEEADMFFHGQADLDRTAEKIQRRVSLLLQELR